jgi:hypothetical protein
MKLRGLIGLMLATTSSAFSQEYTSQPYLSQIGVTAATHAKVDGTGLAIGIMDTPIFVLHSELSGKVYWPPTPVYAGAATYTTSTRSHFHGTWVSSLAAAKKNNSGIVGVAPGANIYTVSVFDTSARWRALDNGKAALDLFAATPQVKVVNMSFGPGGGYAFSGDLNLIPNYQSNFVITKSAGNDGLELKPNGYTGDPSFDYSHVLVVGAVDRYNKLASFSNRPNESCFAAAGCAEDDKWKYMFVVAPGTSIKGAHPRGYVTASGTSAAAPLVAGVVLLVAHDAEKKNVPLTPTDMANIVKMTSTDIGAAGVDGLYGWGLVNAERALAPVGPLTGMVPVDVEGQVGFDSFGRPYPIGSQTVALAPNVDSWNVLMMGQKAQLAFQSGGWNLTARGAMRDDSETYYPSTLNLIGMEKAVADFTFGLSAGALIEQGTMLGHYSRNMNVTRLAMVDAGWKLGAFKLGAFYAMGDIRGMTANAYGIGLSNDTWRLEVVKPLSVARARVPFGYLGSGAIDYRDTSVEQPVAFRLSATFAL